MAIARLPLTEVLDLLEDVYGPPPVQVVTDPWEQVLLENVAYLADDERRLQAFELLRTRVGTSPAALLASQIDELQEVCSVGIRADAQARKLQAAARLALTHFGGDLSTLASMPLVEARRALRRFPAIGEPTADRILLQAGLHAVPALDSNGVRVLVRLGLARDAPSYAVTHRSAVRVVGDTLPADRVQLLRAYLLLRTHGRGLCRRSSPACTACPLATRCPHALRTH
jgi:endonuclease III